ncbi:peptidylprolyl isomerase [Pleionea sp. CnH1-48]|uniref:peptidylprolyl isomerase n=1 Tax=Pleionea sp. CnH1-48 TaxID=2954494 RepID=UPI0020968A5A|nr:peptidylprolyl isomerase [Pleionea sp. CnH1-48]MCO7225323.1 peptidylprolyl isomerase [Pleionea sp. CnH1-48]
MQIEHKKVVYIHYTVKNDAGELIDSSEGKDPLAYLHGYRNIVVGLEKALEGKTTGDKLETTVSPEEGYGEVQEEMVQQVPREQFQGIDNIEVGMHFEAQTEQGPHLVEVTAIDDQFVTVDGNHPLAGSTLNFSVEVIEVREATEEEIAHGHVHGVGGHEH